VSAAITPEPRAAVATIAGVTCALLACALLACAAPRDAAPPLRDARHAGTIANAGLVEASGVAPGIARPGVFWSHNDSGNEPRLFAFDSAGRSLGELRVTGATNRDWEAIATGPCGAGDAASSCVYLGDIGDNSGRQAEVIVWRVPEPSPSEIATARAVGLRVRYADGAHDVEAMWIAPDTSLWFVTKRPLDDHRGVHRPALVFHVHAQAWRTPERIAVAALVDSLPIIPDRHGENWITDAALSALLPDGTRRLAVRTTRDVYVFAADAATGRPSRLLARCSLGSVRDDGGEGVTWLPSGRLLFVNEGRHSRLAAAFCP
jgi:hypothetical protein